MQRGTPRCGCRSGLRSWCVIATRQLPSSSHGACAHAQARCAQLLGVAHDTPVPLEPLLPVTKPAPVAATHAPPPAPAPPSPPSTPAQPLPQRPPVALGASAKAARRAVAPAPAIAPAVPKPQTPTRTPAPPSVASEGTTPRSVSASATRAPLLLTFDVETTGLDPLTNRVIEIAVVDCESGEAFSTLVKPGHARVPQEITRITNIDNKMVNAPHVPGFALAAERLELHIATWAERRGDAQILIAAHNAGFDVGFLRAEYNRIGRKLPSEWRFVDTLDLARSLLPQRKRHKLTDLNMHFNLAQHDAHRAEGDAQMLRNVLGPSGFGSLVPDLHARLLQAAFAASTSTGASRRNTAASSRAAEPLVPEVLQSLLEEADQTDDWESSEGGD